MPHVCVGLAHAAVGEAPDRYSEVSLEAVTAMIAKAAAACCDLAGLVAGKTDRKSVV